MPEIVQYTMTVLCVLRQDVTLGTNLALLQLLWMLVSGALLPSRGAVFPALQAGGLAPAAVRCGAPAPPSIPASGTAPTC